MEAIREAEEEGTRAEEVEVDIKGAEVADIKRFSTQGPRPRHLPHLLWSR